VTNWTWKFSDARVADEGDLKDVVKEVVYEITGTRNGQAYSITGRTMLAAPEEEGFQPFSGLTETNLAAFVSDVVNVDALKHHIDAKHDDASQIKALPFEAAS
jgi:hypothetical protein